MDRFQNTAQPDRDWWEILWPDPQGMLGDLGIQGGTIADVACGDGHFTVPAAELLDRVYAVDIDPELLDELEAAAAKAGVENIERVEGDVRELPSLLPERVETVFFANTLHGVDDPEGFAAGVRECLVEDGRFVVVNWHDAAPDETTVLDEPRGPPEVLRMTPEETVAAVEPAGFKADERVEFEPYHYGVVFRRD